MRFNEIYLFNITFLVDSLNICLESFKRTKFQVIKIWLLFSIFLKALRHFRGSEFSWKCLLKALIVWLFFYLQNCNKTFFVKFWLFFSSNFYSNYDAFYAFIYNYVFIQLFRHSLNSLCGNVFRSNNQNNVLSWLISLWKKKNLTW